MACDIAVMCALKAVLANDIGPGGLVRILKHDPTLGPEFDRIGQYNPDTCAQGKAAYLGITVFGQPLVTAPAPLFQGDILFTACCCGEDADSRIIMLTDRISGLLQGVDEPRGNAWFFNPSSADVTFVGFRLLRGGGDISIDENDRRCRTVAALATWRCCPCPQA